MGGPIFCCDDNGCARQWLRATMVATILVLGRYARDNSCLSSAWDWAAQCPALKPSALFDGYFGADRPTAPAPSPQDDPPGTSKPTIQLSAAVTPTPDEILRRRCHPPTRQSSPGATTIPSPSPTQPSVSQPRGGRRGDETPKESPDPQPTGEACANIPEFKPSYRLKSPPRTPRTSPSGEDARGRYARPRSEFRPASPRRGNSRAPSQRPSNPISEWRNDWERGWPKK